MTGRWLRLSIRHWIIEPRVVWFALIVIFFSLSCLFFGQITEKKIRLIGLALQVFGMGAVLCGIRQTRLFFQKPNIFNRVVARVRNRPRPRPSKIIGSGYATVPEFTASGSGYSWFQNKNGCGVEFRLDSIERNLIMVREMTLRLREECRESSELFDTTVNRETSNLRRSVDEANERLENASTGGLDVSLMGAVWLMIGVILSTASIEFFYLMK